MNQQELEAAASIQTQLFSRLYSILTSWPPNSTNDFLERLAQWLVCNKIHNFFPETNTCLSWIFTEVYS